jgi:hypothetical protein
MDDPTLLTWIERGQNIAALLVAVGVAAEFLLGFISSPIRKRLDRAHESEIARLRKETEDERTARVKLEAKVAWRRLSKEQQLVIADRLSHLSEMKVGVSYLGGNPEAAQFAEDIAAALQAAQWKVHSLEPFSLFGGYGGGVYPLHPSTGVNVSTIGETGRAASEAIQHELCSLGFDTAITPRPPRGKTEPSVDVEVLVVARPIAPQGATKLTINPNTRTCIGNE